MRTAMNIAFAIVMAITCPIWIPIGALVLVFMILQSAPPIEPRPGDSK
jgi:hypothetical protein